jgi:hypothetical protein
MNHLTWERERCYKETERLIKKRFGNDVWNRVCKRYDGGMEGLRRRFDETHTKDESRYLYDQIQVAVEMSKMARLTRDGQVRLCYRTLQENEANEANEANEENEEELYRMVKGSYMFRPFMVHLYWIFNDNIKRVGPPQDPRFSQDPDSEESPPLTPDGTVESLEAVLERDVERRSSKTVSGESITASAEETLSKCRTFGDIVKFGVLHTNYFVSRYCRGPKGMRMQREHNGHEMWRNLRMVMSEWLAECNMKRLSLHM